MAVFLSKQTMKKVDPNLLRKTWQNEGYLNSSINSIIETAVDNTHSDVIIQTDMVEEILSTMKEKQISSEFLFTLFDITRWRLQGTDGIRAIVDTKEVDLYQSLIEFTNNTLLTPRFCYLYISSFIELALSNELYKNLTHIAFGEDGRDYYQGSPLKKSIHQALSDMGITMVDLGIIPTPYVAQYTAEYHSLAIMLTASHNPPQYNGIKLFVDGKKLYPNGEMGEHKLSALVLERSTRKEISRNYLITPILFNTKNLYLKNLLEACKNISSEVFKECPLLIDCANGAASSIFSEILDISSIPFISIAGTQKQNTINYDSGVAILEDLEQSVSYSENLPSTVKRLFKEARSRKVFSAYAAILDGDGDRAFLLQYKKIEKENSDRVLIYNGDSLGYIICALYNEKEDKKPLFVHTIESDFSLQKRIKQDLNIETSYTCVGDRWVVDRITSSGNYGIGCEKSGHVVFPLPLENNSVLYSGNGMLSALYALSYLLDHKSFIPFSEGYNAKEVVRGKIIYQFYRNSYLWISIYTAIVPFFIWDYDEQIITNEPHILFISFIDKGKEIGWFYMRKSGTEEKMSYLISLLGEYEDEGNKMMSNIKRKISHVCELKQQMISK